MKIRSLRSAKNFKGKTALLRANFDVPLEFKGKKAVITDDFKIVSSLPTIRYLSRYGAKVVILSHMDRPEGRDPRFTQKVASQYLQHLLGKKVLFADDCIGDQVREVIGKMKDGQVLLLENLRFYQEESANDAKFARELAGLAKGGFYVNDAFSNSHRAHASMNALPKLMPAYAGFQLEKEIESLEKVLSPKHPSVAIMGGAKISTKIKLISRIAKIYDTVLIGGAMANNFMSARGLEIGRSLVSEEDIGLARKMNFKNVLIPIDVVVSGRKDGKGKVAIRDIAEVRKTDTILDIGPQTVSLYADYIKKAMTILWNGPMGKFEDPSYKHGTMSIAKIVAVRSTGRAFGVVGGGETVEALKKSRMLEYVDLVSTGGGAMLDYLAGEKMPGLDAVFRRGVLRL
jgi:3-phosphoglycerate kinase